MADLYRRLSFPSFDHPHILPRDTGLVRKALLRNALRGALTLKDPGEGAGEASTSHDLESFSPDCYYLDLL
jgi:hypothetical protein